AAFEVDAERAVDDIEELVLLVVLVPMEFTLQHAEANHAVVHFAQRLVHPLLLGRALERLHVDQLERLELDIALVRVRGLHPSPQCGLGAIMDTCTRRRIRCATRRRTRGARSSRSARTACLRRRTRDRWSS